MTNIPHKHAAVIHAWADGAQIQWCQRSTDKWVDAKAPQWHDCYQYRVKPEKKRGRVWVGLFLNGTPGFPPHPYSTCDHDTAMALAKVESFIKWIKEGEEFEYDLGCD